MRNRYVLLADVVGVGSAAFGAFILYFEWRFFQSHPEFLFFLVRRTNVCKLKRAES